MQTSLSLKRVFEKMDNSNSNKKDKVNSLFALDIVKASEEHTKLQTFVLFKQAINDDIKCP